MLLFFCLARVVIRLASTLVSVPRAAAAAARIWRRDKSAAKSGRREAARSARGKQMSVAMRCGAVWCAVFLQASRQQRKWTGRRLDLRCLVEVWRADSAAAGLGGRRGGTRHMAGLRRPGLRLPGLPLILYLVNGSDILGRGRGWRGRCGVADAPPPGVAWRHCLRTQVRAAAERHSGLGQIRHGLQGYTSKRKNKRKSDFVFLTLSGCTLFIS